jgi:hypothetical protein
MRKLLFTAVLLIVLLALPVCAHAWEWTIDDAGTLEISGNGAVDDFGAASETPWYGKHVRQVIVHEGITKIGSYAFRNSTKLAAVTLPDSLEILGVSAVEGCSSLETVTFGIGLRKVEEYAFQDCSSLTGVYITDVEFYYKETNAEITVDESTWTGDSITATVTSDQFIGNAAVMVAAYDENDKMIGCAVERADISAGTQEIPVSLGLSDGADYVKGFLWEGYGYLMPWSASYSSKAE